MDLVCAHQPLSAWELPVHRTLTAEERAMLARLCAGGADDRLADSFIRGIWSARLWLACDCRGPKRAPPLLFVARRSPGGLGLATMRDRPPHTAGCTFASIADEGPMVGDGGAELGSLLLRWIQSARLNVVLPYQGSDFVHAQYQALRDASRSLELAPGRRLYEFSRSHPAGLIELHRRLATGSAGDAAPNRAVYVSCVALLSDADLRASVLHPAQELHRLPSLISRDRVVVWPDAEGAGGAHLVMYGLMLNARSEVELDTAAAIPVFSRGLLVPVTGSHERTTLNCLLEVQRSVLDAHHLVIGIRKALPGSASYERGIAFQLQLLGPNGRVVRHLDIVSVDCVTGERTPAEMATELDWRHDRDVSEKVRAGGVHYHFVGADGRSADRTFTADLLGWLHAAAEYSR